MILSTAFRGRAAGWAACALLALAGVAHAGAAPRAPAAPGERAPGLRYFRLAPASTDTVYRLLVIPVRFPEDAVLGGGGRDSLAAALTDTARLSLATYWRRASFGRIRMDVSLAPTFVPAHIRAYYASEGEGNAGYGLDPRAYPHNAQRLAEEATAALADRVDFARYDNTGDGIADGLLLLQSGPPAPEVIDPSVPRSVLLPHAFTLPAPEERRDARVFPYAVAATRDAVGPWAHEVGHLLGLVDLYVSNPLCSGAGLGERSLMATGANRGGGADPTGLDAFSRQLLGFVPRTGFNLTVPLAGGAFLRVFTPGETSGPRYFLVERQDGTNGLAVPFPATVVYAVDETAVDNRNCVRPLVAIRAEACPGSDPCATHLDDGTDPDLRDGDGNRTGVALDLTEATTRAGTTAGFPLRIASVRVLDPGAGGSRPLAVRIENLDPARDRRAVLELARLPGSAVCVARRGEPDTVTVPAGGSVTDLAWAAVPCAEGDSLSASPGAVAFTLAPPEGGVAALDTLVVDAGPGGLAAGALAVFTARNLAPPRRNPWGFTGGAWTARSLAPLADAEIESPWFRVPGGGRLVVVTAWNLTALAPDAAEDAGQVRLLLQTGAPVPLAPPLGWGHTAERGTGDALGGLEVLSGSSGGERPLVFDLGAYAGRTVRIAFRAAGDAVPDSSAWTVSAVRVAGAPPVSFALNVDVTPDGNHRLSVAADGPVPAGTQVSLFGGRRVALPAVLLAAGGPALSVSASPPPSATPVTTWSGSPPAAPGARPEPWWRPLRPRRRSRFPPPTRSAGGASRPGRWTCHRRDPPAPTGWP